MKILKASSRFVIISSVIATILAGCQSNAPDTDVESYQDVAKTSMSGKYVRPLKDGAPWWDVDVSNIPDAIPVPHNGAYKKAPYNVLGKSYYPIPTANNYSATGTASWYGTKFHGQSTANGEVYDLYGMTAAHKTLPLPSYVKVTNLENGRSVILRVNDRGPFYSDRVIDLSFAAAKKLGYADAGTARVHVEGIDPVAWWASKGMAAPQTDAEAQAQLAAAKKIKHTEKVQEPTTLGVIVKEYEPPANQHAVSIDSKKKDTLPVAGLYLQVGAFANPDAAELLRQRLIEVTAIPVFISPIIQGAQQLYRVRLGPIPSQQEMFQTQNAIRVAKLGQATLVKRD